MIHKKKKSPLQPRPEVPARDRWIQIALKEASKAAVLGEVPVGAVLVDEATGKVLLKSHNLKESKRDASSHAEIELIRKFGKSKFSDQTGFRMQGLTVVVTLEPCLMCLAALIHARVGKVIYAALDAKGGALSLGYTLHQDARLNHKIQMEYVECPDSSKVLKDFFKELRALKK